MMSSMTVRLAQTALVGIALACGCSAEVIDEADLGEEEAESVASSSAAVGVARGGFLAPDKLLGGPVVGPAYPGMPGVGPYPGALQYGGGGLPFGGYPGPAGCPGGPLGGFGGYPGLAGYTGGPLGGFGGYPGPAGYTGAPFGGFGGPGAPPGYPGALGGAPFGL
jgi:hypothetical protein